MNFSQLGLAPAQVRSCESLGYTEPTPIQRQAIPVVLSGQDLIGCAETGTGKTAAFLLPIIQNESTEKRPRPGVRVLVLAPTRELATQIEKNYGELNRVKANRSVTVIGGANMRTQIADLATRRGSGDCHARTLARSDRTRRGRSFRRRSAGAGRSGPHAGHGISCRRFAACCRWCRQSGRRFSSRRRCRPKLKSWRVRR